MGNEIVFSNIFILIINITIYGVNINNAYFSLSALINSGNDEQSTDGNNNAI